MTCTWREARENECVDWLVSFGFSSDWMKKWRAFLSQSCCVVKKNQTLFDTHMKTAVALSQTLLYPARAVNLRDLFPFTQDSPPLCSRQQRHRNGSLSRWTWGVYFCRYFTGEENAYAMLWARSAWLLQLSEIFERWESFVKFLSSWCRPRLNLFVRKLWPYYIQA